MQSRQYHPEATTVIESCCCKAENIHHPFATIFSTGVSLILLSHLFWPHGTLLTDPSANGAQTALSPRPTRMRRPLKLSAAYTAQQQVPSVERSLAWRRRPARSRRRRRRRRPERRQSGRQGEWVRIATRPPACQAVEQLNDVNRQRRLPCFREINDRTFRHTIVFP